jgi:hypothetical protein
VTAYPLSIRAIFWPPRPQLSASPSNCQTKAGHSPVSHSSAALILEFVLNDFNSPILPQRVFGRAGGQAAPGQGKHDIKRGERARARERAYLRARARRSCVCAFAPRGYSWFVLSVCLWRFPLYRRCSVEGGLRTQCVKFTRILRNVVDVTLAPSFASRATANDHSKLKPSLPPRQSPNSASSRGPAINYTYDWCLTALIGSQPQSSSK